MKDFIIKIFVRLFLPSMILLSLIWIYFVTLVFFYLYKLYNYIKTNIIEIFRCLLIILIWLSIYTLFFLYTFHLIAIINDLIYEFERINYYVGIEIKPIIDLIIPFRNFIEIKKQLIITVIQCKLFGIPIPKYILDPSFNSMLQLPCFDNMRQTIDLFSFGHCKKFFDSIVQEATFLYKDKLFTNWSNSILEYFLTHLFDDVDTLHSELCKRNFSIIFKVIKDMKII